MHEHYFFSGRRFALLLGLWLMLSGAMASYALARVPSAANVREDAHTCEGFGAQYGSAEYAKCMLIQQRRRAAETMDAMERQRISAEIARTNVETVRRMRCEREAKRERESGVRPRPCW